MLGNSFMCTAAVELLYHFVALTEERLLQLVSATVAVSENPASFGRALDRYRREWLLAALSPEAVRGVEKAGVARTQARRLLQLGLAGEEYARRMGWSGDAPIVATAEIVMPSSSALARTRS